VREQPGGGPHAIEIVAVREWIPVADRGDAREMGRDSWEPVEQPLMTPPMTTTGIIAAN
jgi:hypothetical protein